MQLKPQDVYVALKLVALRGAQWSMQRIGVSIGMSASQVHASIHRLVKARLVWVEASYASPRVYKPIVPSLLEFLEHGVRFSFVPEIGGPSRGVPTGVFAPPLAQKVVATDELPYVWPYAEGRRWGISFSPLHKSAPYAAMNDEAFYELLALVDAIRAGGARERALAIEMLEHRMRGRCEEIPT